jgi:hypothetical protein
MSRARMTMRAEIERDTATGTDAHGHPVAPVFAPTGDPVPCFVWSTASRQAVGAGRVALIEDIRAMFPVGADIRAGDEIARVTDRLGTVLVNGRLRVDGEPQRKHRHLEAALERVS